MALAPIEKGREIAERERENLAAGVRAEPLLKHAVQRFAARGLAVFLILMLALTLLSRAADSVTVARVEVQEGRTGVLTQRVTMGGTIEAQGDLEITLPAGIRVTGLPVSKGQAVQAGDALLELDGEALARAVEKLESDLALLDLKIEAAAQGGTGAGADAVVNAQAALEAAQAALEDAQEDYERLAGSRGKTEDRAKEDETQAQAARDEALAALEKAELKAKEALEKTAREKADAAREAREETEETARETKETAQKALDSAKEAQVSMNNAYFMAQDAYERAKQAVSSAQADYDTALEGGSEAAIIAASAALNQAESNQDAAEATWYAASDRSADADVAVRRAKEDLQKATEKWDAKVNKAKEAEAEAEAALAEAQSKTDMSEEPLVVSSQAVLDVAEATLRSAQRGTEDALTATEDALLAAQRMVEGAQRTVESAQRSHSQASSAAGREREADESAGRRSEIERLGYVGERREVAKKLEELRAISDAGGVLAAPIAGVVMDLMAETGTTQEGQRVAVLSRSDKGFEFSGKVGEKDAEKLAPGDEATLSYTKDGKSQEVKAVLLSVGAADANGEVEVRAALPEGGWPAGTSARLEVSKRSQQYQTVLPLGALRGGGSDTFVLVLREKSTVMGAEQTVEKLPVTIQDKDSEQVALTDGVLPYGERVVVSASKPVSEGDRVRVGTGK